MAESEMNRNKRYYALHREECNALRLARYHNNPAVIAKREERERIKVEKEAIKQAEKEAKKAEKEKNRQKCNTVSTSNSKSPKKYARPCK
jgi:hypothetical protein